MRKQFTLSLLFIMLIWGTAQAQVPRGSQATSEKDTAGVSGSVITGGVTIDGQNYQQFGVRTDIPLGKLGFGVDIQLLFDSDGRIRTEDWDEWTDYLDKIYYIRYGRRNDPFYVKAGGLDYSYMGYNNIIDGYTNMIEYPTIRRYGLELAIDGDKLGAELLLNDFKEVFAPQASMVYGARVSYKVIGKLEIGASIAGDLNEYNGLKDLDEDNIPDPIDQYPENDKWATEYTRFYTKAIEGGLNNADAEEFTNNAVDFGLIDGIRDEDLFSLADNTSSSLVYSADIGYPIIDRSNFRMEIFSHFTQIQNYGWGITAPGLIFGVGNFLTLTAEYRMQSDQFVYGYFNNTYELERAKFVADPVTGQLNPVTKQETLENITNDMQGFFAGMDINLMGLAGVGVRYQDMSNDDMNNRSLNGYLELKDKLLPIIHEAKAYYVQNNVQDFQEWKTPSTVMGYLMSYDFNGTVVGLDYRYTFRDANGDGVISGKDETIKTFGFSTKMTF